MGPTPDAWKISRKQGINGNLITFLRADEQGEGRFGGARDSALAPECRLRASVMGHARCS